MSDLHPLTAAVCAVVGLGGGLLVPRLVARIPEPEPEDAVDGAEDAFDGAGPDPEPRGPLEPKEPYAAIAALPGLAARTAAAGAVSAALLGLALGWQWPLVVVMALVPVAVALAVVDWRTRLLPTWVIAPTYAATIALVVLTWLLAGDLGEPAPLVRALVGWVGAGGLYFVLWFVYPRGMGYGDVRLSGVLGIALGYVGWAELVVGIYGGFLLGGVLGGLLSLLRRVDRKGYPFGPFMLLGALVGVVAGQAVIDALVA